MNRQRFRVALVGCGYIARRVHLPLLRNSKNVDLVALCDIDSKKATEASKEYGVRNTYTHLTDIPESETPDIVDVCTPPATHVRIVKEAFEMGCHCFLEKPITVRVSEADELIQISREKGLKLFVLHNYSYVPCIRKARQIISKGKLGKPLWAETRYLTSLERERFYDSNHWIHKLPGGILNSELLPHLLMLILDFVGSPMIESKLITNKVRNLPYVPADELKMSMLSSTKALGYVGLSFNSPIFSHTMEVIGDRGGIFVDHLTQTVVYRKVPASSSHADSEVTSPIRRGSWALSELLQKLTGVTAVAMNTTLGRYKMMSEGHRYLFERAFDELNGGPRYPVDLEKCREVVRLLETVYEHVS